jgi:hypothetical protein
VRGIRALKEVGLQEEVVDRHGIPMKGRMIHNVDGSRQPILYDPRSKQVLLRYNEMFVVSKTFVRIHKKHYKQSLCHVFHRAVSQ